ncbi:MAG: 16S rRNA (cytidine(1402)-2'-O)-methyltransferase [Elusimicrobia bacterium]|nr:16S rRNA (cytidine(1402)-2'-O)-methyltransferase [Elusimicrobiota bacterium]
MLAIIPTPLGNLEDMPPRALRALREAAAVYCEDTRRTRNLMAHFGLDTPVLRYNERDERDNRRLLERLQAGDDLALVSDGGLPCISDPGRRLVALASRNGIAVTVLPGPSAAVAAVAGSGLPGDSFVFLGFLPRAPGKKRKILQETAALGRTLVLYESPYRVVELLLLAEETLGAKAQACVVRELSKLHEEWLRGTLGEVRARLAARAGLLGEFVVVLHPEEAPEHA